MLDKKTGQQVGWLTWRGDGMEAFTADGTLVGKYQTRREATSALWKTPYVQAVRRGLSPHPLHQDYQE
jgi:hypothetical protein